MLDSEATQQTLSGEEFPAHLTKDPSHREIHNTDVKAGELTSREFWCVDCGKRVTRALERSGEYGHQGCEHSIRHEDDHSLSPSSRGEG